MRKKTQNDPTKVPISKMIGWQTRPISLGAITIIFGYLSLYCTDTLGMDAMVVGTLLMVSKFIDGITDLVAGWIVDNTNTKFGKGRPYEFSIIGVWICTYALFATDVSWSMPAKCAWLFVMYTLVWSVFSTLLNAAETPYIIRAFGDRVAITKVSAYGGILVTVGAMVVSISFPIMVNSVATSAAGWRQLMLMYGIPLAILGMLRFILVKEDFVEENAQADRVNLKDILRVLKSNKYIWLLALVTTVPQMITGMGAATYYFERVVGDISLYSTIQGISFVALLLMVVFPALMKKFSAMQIIGYSAVIGFVGYVILFFAGVNLPLLIVGFLLSSLVSLPTSYMRSVIIMQIADYNESKGNPRMEGTIGSAVSQKRQGCI